MTGGIGGLGSFSSAQFEKMFTRIDTNADGTVSKDEFVAGAPDDLSAEKAGALYDKLDSEGTGALSQSDLATAFQQMAASMQAGMIQAQSLTSTGGDGSLPDASDLFDKLDTDGDGAVSQEEFVAGRPDDVSEEDAAALYGKLFGEDTESVDSETFVAAMQPPSGGGAGGGGNSESDETYDALDTNKDGVVSREEFLAGRPDDVSEEEATALFESLAGEDADSITAEQLAQGMQGPPPPPAEESGATLTQDEQDLVDKLIAALQSSDAGTSADGTLSSAMQQLVSAIEAYTKSQQSGAALYGSDAVSALSLSA